MRVCFSFSLGPEQACSRLFDLPFKPTKLGKDGCAERRFRAKLLKTSISLSSTTGKLNLHTATGVHIPGSAQSMVARDGDTKETPELRQLPAPNRGPD